MRQWIKCSFFFFLPPAPLNLTNKENLILAAKCMLNYFKIQVGEKSNFKVGPGIIERYLKIKILKIKIF